VDRLTQVQQGLLGENEFWKLVVLETNGQIEPRRPLPDDERIDFFIHALGRIEPVIAIQVKTSARIRRAGRANRLFIHFDAPRAGLITHPRFWYFLNHFDNELRSVRDPVFLAPSTFVHPLAVPFGANRVRFYLEASMDPQSKDRWAPYRISTGAVGKRILTILRELPTESLAQKASWQSLVAAGLGSRRGRRKAA
jgi:hypothetical protein